MNKKLLVLLLTFTAYSGFSQNNYIDFDGVNDNISIADSGNLLASSSSISMSCKVFPKNANPSFPAFNGFAGYRNDSNFDFYIIQLSSTEVEARFRNSSGTEYTLTYSGLVLNQWNHFFLVYDGSYLSLFSGSDEVASIEASGSTPASNSSNFNIGNVKFSSYNFYHDGYIDEVSLWSKALSVTEIDNIIINNGEISSPTTQNNLEVYYKFDQGVAYGNNSGLTTLNDEMGSLNGTLNNFGLNGPTSNWGSEDTMSTQNFNNSNFHLYPNPVSNTLNFSGLSEKINLQIVDIYGRTILSKKATDPKSIDLSGISKGIYFAIVDDNQPIKFIKN